MPFMQWSSMLAIDDGEIDRQHRALVDAINDLHAGLAQARGDECLAETLAFLQDYAERHFSEEEAMLAQAAYPRLEQHRGQHRAFVEQIRAFRAQIADGGSGLGHNMAQFLGSWLVNHIMVADKAYASFLRSHGAVAEPALHSLGT